MPKVKLIAVSPENYETLRKFGEFQDSFDDIITKILNKVDGMNVSDTDSRSKKEDVTI